MNQPHKPLSIFVLNTYWLRFYSGLRHKGGLLPRALQILSKAAWNREVGLFISSERETSYCDDTNTKEVERTSNRNISNSLFWSWAFDIIGRRQSVEQMVCKHGRPQSSRLVDENVPPSSQVHSWSPAEHTSDVLEAVTQFYYGKSHPNYWLVYIETEGKELEQELALRWSLSLRIQIINERKAQLRKNRCRKRCQQSQNVLIVLH